MQQNPGSQNPSEGVDIVTHRERYISTCTCIEFTKLQRHNGWLAATTNVDPFISHDGQLWREQAVVAIKVEQLLQEEAKLAREADAVLLAQLHYLHSFDATLRAPA